MTRPSYALSDMYQALRVPVTLVTADTAYHHTPRGAIYCLANKLVLVASQPLPRAHRLYDNTAEEQDLIFDFPINIHIHPQVLQRLDTCLLEYTRIARDRGTLEQSLDVLAELLKLSARPSTGDLVYLSENIPLERLKTSYLRAVSSARNPFIPGINLSVALVKAAESAPEGNRRSLISLQKVVVALLLEILEQLPQAVRTFEGGVVGCSAMLEPEGLPGNTTAMRAPLRVLLKKRQLIETFCSAPLVMDFLTRRFTAGLPDIWDSDHVLSNKKEFKYLAGDGNDENNSLVLCSLQRSNPNSPDYFDHPEAFDRQFNFGERLLLRCQGTEASFPSLTILTGVQFIVAGVLAKPNSYYSVPLMRMVFHLLVYLAMLALFSAFVLFHEEGPQRPGEIIVAVLFVLVSGNHAKGGHRTFQL